MPLSLPQAKRDLCDIGHRMWLRGFCAGNDGNLSLRLSTPPTPPGRFLATPTGVSKGFMQPEMMVVVDSNGRQIGRSRYQRTSEIFMHLAVYRHRPDVQAVVHAHLPHATAYACSGIPLPRGVYPEAEVCLGVVPTVPYVKPGGPALGDACVAQIKSDTNAILLGNHGAVTFGKTLTEAWFRLEMLESYCQILLLLKQIGRVRKLTPRELSDLQNRLK